MIKPADQSFTVLIKQKAKDTGFDLCGIAKVRPLVEYGPALRIWCAKGMNDKMSYLERDIPKRLDPGKLMEGARSMIVTGLSYYSENRQKDPDAPVISRYTYGINYHDVIREKLLKLLAFIKSVKPEAKGSIFIDTAPLLEKAWAREAGLGWQGRHTVIINKEIGSFFFLGCLVLDIDLDYDAPYTKDLCRNCRRCIDECPTGAINENRTIDARKCIANLTIENRGPVPEDLLPKLGRRIYGCDKCQEVCPWNARVKPNAAPEFTLNKKVAAMSLDDWRSLTKDEFIMYFKRSSMERVSYEQLKNNIEAVTNIP